MKEREKLLWRGRLALCCVVFIASFFFCISASFDTVSVCVLFVNLTGCIVCSVCGAGVRRYVRFAAFLLGASVLGTGLALLAKYTHYYPSVRFLEKYRDTECEMVLRVDRVDSYGDSYGNYDCSILMCNGENTEKVFGAYPSLRLSCFGADFSEKGDIISVIGTVSVPEKETSSGFEEENYLKSRHIFAVCENNGATELLYEGEKSAVDAVRDALGDNLSTFISDSESAAVAKCMLLGDKTGVPKYLKNTFRAAGISHILSVSGLHLSMLFMTASILFGLRRKSPRRRVALAEAVSCVLILMYMILADFTPSIMRAGFMHIFMNLYAMGLFYKRKLGCTGRKSELSCDNDGDADKSETGSHSGYYYLKASKSEGGVFDSVCSLFLAGVCILIISPYSVFDIGMQLSFMSTLGILIAFYASQGFVSKLKNPIVRAAVVSVIVSVAAASFTLPLCIYNFGMLSTVSVITNLIISPVMTVLLALLFGLAVISLLPHIGVVSAVCCFLGKISGFLCGVCIRCAEVMGGFLFSAVDTGENVITVAVFVVYAIFTVVCYLLGRKRLCSFGMGSLAVLYAVFLGVSFIGTAVRLSQTNVAFCTVNRRPYLCVHSMDNRIIIDDASGIASDSIMRKSFGETLYKTDNYYLVVPNENADSESLLFNIVYLDRIRDIKTVLLPSETVREMALADCYGYSELLAGLSENGIEYSFYSENFEICGVEFSYSAKEGYRSFSFDGIAAVFGDEYSAGYASDSSENSDYCIYFCNRAFETDNSEYNSDARLFVSSPHWKKINGAESIPTRKPHMLK